MTEMKSGCAVFDELRRVNREHSLEKVGEEIRSSFVWGKDKKIVDRTRN